MLGELIWDSLLHDDRLWIHNPPIALKIDSPFLIFILQRTLFEMKKDNIIEYNSNHLFSILKYMYTDRWYRFTWSGWTPMRRCQSISWSGFGAFFWGTRRHWVGWSPSGLAAWRCGMISGVLISNQVYAKSTKLLFIAKSRVRSVALDYTKFLVEMWNMNCKILPIKVESRYSFGMLYSNQLHIKCLVVKCRNIILYTLVSASLWSLSQW